MRITYFLILNSQLTFIFFLLWVPFLPDLEQEERQPDVIGHVHCIVSPIPIISKPTTMRRGQPGESVRDRFCPIWLVYVLIFGLLWFTQVKDEADGRVDKSREDVHFASERYKFDFCVCIFRKVNRFCGYSIRVMNFWYFLLGVYQVCLLVSTLGLCFSF